MYVSSVTSHPYAMASGQTIHGPSRLVASHCLKPMKWATDARLSFTLLWSMQWWGARGAGGFAGTRASPPPLLCWAQASSCVIHQQLLPEPIAGPGSERLFDLRQRGMQALRLSRPQRIHTLDASAPTVCKLDGKSMKRVSVIDIARHLRSGLTQQHECAAARVWPAEQPVTTASAK